VLYVWQAKDFEEGVFGSVARKGVTGEILGSVASKEDSGNGKWKSENGNWWGKKGSVPQNRPGSAMSQAPAIEGIGKT
jgi:hypothetical protein